VVVVVVMTIRVDGAFIRCHIMGKFIRGARRRWMVPSVISLGMEFVRGVVLEKRGYVVRGYAL
jgi:hypothetical protein